MKKLLIGLWLSAIATVAYANCTTQTITSPNGKMLFCQTCCYYGNCNTVCY